MPDATTLSAAVDSRVPNIANRAEGGLDPRSWLLAFVSTAAWVSASDSLLATGSAVVVLAALWAVLHRRFHNSAVSSLSPLRSALWAAVLTIVLYAIFGSSESSNGVRVFGRVFAFDTLQTGLTMALRLVALLLMSFILMSAVGALGLAAGATRILLPLQRFGIPVASVFYLAFFLSRMVPVLVQEARLIAMAQRSRAGGGARHGIHRWRLVPALVLPVFSSALRRSGAVALVLASRGFDTSKLPSRVSSLRFRTADWVVFAGVVLLWATWLYAHRSNG